MAFLHGKCTKVYLNGYDLTGYLSKIETGVTVDTADVTTFCNTAKKYIPGPVDSTLMAEGLYDGATGAVDDIINTALGAEYGLWSWYFGGDTAGNIGYGAKTINNEYNIMSTIDDAVRTTIGGQVSEGRERLISLLALGQKTSTGSSTAIDNGADTTNGGSAYLHVTDVTGTVSVKIEHSQDDISYSDLASFTDVDTDHISERVTFTGDVYRYTKVTYTLGGGETITMQVGLHRN
jgi:hypothetical protein